MKGLILPIFLYAAGGYFVLMFAFDLLLRGFSPFITNRPWVVEQLMPEIRLKRNKPVTCVAFSSGRSGFVTSISKEYPDATIIGYESKIFPYLVAITQKFIRRTNIHVKFSAVHRTKVKDADFIYCHLKPDQMRGIGKKFKFECKPGAQIISTGFVVPYLTASKIIELPDKKGRFNFLSKNQNLFQSKQKKFKKEKKAFIYEI